MMGYQVEAAFSAVCRTTSTIRSPRGFPPAAKCSEIFIRLFPHTKYCVPFSACMTCPVRGVKISLSLFAIQCPPYSVFKVQCRTEAAKISAYTITFPLPCAAAAVSVPLVYPAGYGQPAAVNCPVRFSALPVPSYLSSFLFRWPLPLLPTSHSPPAGH